MRHPHYSLPRERVWSCLLYTSPRTRQRGFMPVILGVLKEQEKEMGEVASYLYSCGNTMKDISGVFERLYGKSYSTSQVNRLALSTQKAVLELSLIHI